MRPKQAKCSYCGTEIVWPTDVRGPLKGPTYTCDGCHSLEMSVMYHANTLVGTRAGRLRLKEYQLRIRHVLASYAAGKILAHTKESEMEPIPVFRITTPNLLNLCVAEHNRNLDITPQDEECARVTAIWQRGAEWASTQPSDAVHTRQSLAQVDADLAEEIFHAYTCGDFEEHKYFEPPPVELEQHDVD